MNNFTEYEIISDLSGRWNSFVYLCLGERGDWCAQWNRREKRRENKKRNRETELNPTTFSSLQLLCVFLSFLFSWPPTIKYLWVLNNNNDNKNNNNNNNDNDNDNNIYCPSDFLFLIFFLFATISYFSFVIYSSPLFCNC